MQRFVSRSRSYGDELDKGRRTAMRNGGVYIDTEVFSPTERKSLAFYRDIIQPQGIGSQLALYLMLRRRMFGVVHLCRRMGRPGFREMDLSVLRPMLPILVTSHAAVMAAEGLRACGQQQGPMECTLASLSGREREVAHYVAHGLSNKEIASFLGTSPNTVRNQLVRIFEKLGVSSRAELASQLARGGLADFPMPVPDLSAAG
ncbi:MAG: hypothetical protein HY698_12280 [Deltaproteobacteria bacterium]|nr:hypothetical protein [Deltaproteobacteria bacterium]